MQKRILIIDDQPFMTKLIEYNLKKANYITFTETNGLKALQNINKLAPDLVLLDIKMPLISGLDLCQKLKKEKIMLNVPIIFLTTQRQSDIKNEAMNAGADDYMTKPFSPIELNKKIQTLLGN